MWLSSGPFLVLLLSRATAFVAHRPLDSSPSHRPTIFWSAKEERESPCIVPAEITTKALVQLYPALLEHTAKYGNPNIPLGTLEGRQCSILKRMQVQGKLTDAEVQHLKDLGFLFHELEDLYQQVDFEEMLPRLMTAKEDHGSLDIPKKYAPDPELGAWVTGIRRLGRDRVDPDHADRLDDCQFVWVSSRKCGSKFMEQYRSIVQRLQNELKETVLNDPEVVKFVRAQKEAYKRKTLSDTRVEYMTRITGDDQWWMERE